MNQEFMQGVVFSRETDKVRPQVQRQARAITESVPPLSRRETDGDLPYPYPGKGVGGETTN